MDHIETMEYLRDSVRLRAYGQRDPLVEYKIEGQKLFQQLMESIKLQVANLIFKVSFVQQPRQVKMEEGKKDIETGVQKQPASPELQRGEQAASVDKEERKIGRNDPCWCGAKKPDGRPIKYKHCHGK